MARIDCWRLLGLPPGASADQVRAAFARRARDVHPDGGGTGDSLTMRLLVEARDEALELIGRGEAAPAAADGQARAARQAQPRSDVRRCYACGAPMPQAAAPKRRFRPGMGDGRSAAGAPLCAACARRRQARDPERRKRRLLLGTLALSTIATIALALYMLRMF